MLFTTSTAWAAAPGKRLVDYLATRALPADRAAIRGVRVDGGKVISVNGQPAVRGATAVVLTRLADSNSGGYAAQRLCGLAAVGVKRLGLRSIATVDVRARDGRSRAVSLVIGLPSCHLIR